MEVTIIRDGHKIKPTFGGLSIATLFSKNGKLYSKTHNSENCLNAFDFRSMRMATIENKAIVEPVSDDATITITIKDPP